MHFEFMLQFSIIYVPIIQRAIKQSYIGIILDGEYKIINCCCLHVLHSVKLSSIIIELSFDISVYVVPLPMFLLPFPLLCALHPTLL